MARLVLQIFFIITISHITISKSLKNASSSSSSELETSSQDKYESPIIQVSPIDIENNTGPFMRSDSGLNRLLALSNQHNLAIDSNLNTDTLSADNLANQIGVTVIEPNPLVNLVNTDTSGQVTNPQVKPYAVDLNAQSVNDFLNSNALLNQIPNNNQLTNQYIINAVKTPQEINGYTMQKVYPEVMMKSASDTLLNTNPSLIQGQGVNNLFQQGSVLTDANEQLLKSIQSLLNQQGDYTRKNVYQTPNQYQSLNVDNPTLNLGLLDKQAARDSQIMGLLNNPLSNQLLDVDSLLGEAAFNANQVMDLNPLTGQGINANQYLNTNLESILEQEDLSKIQNLLQANQGNQYGTLPNTNLETRLVFDNHIPNLNEPNCRAAFGALVNNALVQYLKLAQLPFCMGGGHNAFPSTNLPFQIIIAPTGTSGQSNTNPLLLKMLWILLNKLKNQVGLLQDQSHLPSPVEPFNNAAVQPLNNIADNLLSPLNPNENTASVLPFKILPNQKPNPYQPYLNNVLNQKLPNLMPDYPFQGPSGVDSGPNQFPVYPGYPGPTVGPSPFQRTTLIPSDSQLEPQYPTQPPVYPTGFPILPNSPMQYQTDLSTGILPTDFTDSLSSPLVKYLIQLFRKFLPLRVLTPDDIVYLTQLLNALPKTYNELLQNPALLQQIILQLTNRHLNPQLVLALLYKYVIPLNQPSLLGLLPSDRVVVLKYQVKRHTPYVYQPYYYVQYKLPYSNFVKNLQQLLMYKPYLKLNRAQLLKELLIAAMANNYGTASDFNGVSKEYLMQLVANQGATPLDVKVVNDNISYEQLKLLNDFNLQLRSDSTVPQTGLNSGLLGGGQVVTGPNLMPYLAQSSSGQMTNLNLVELTTAHPILKYLRRSENTENTVQQTRDEVSNQQEDLPSVDVKKEP